jgi:hypothetical protein
VVNDFPVRAEAVLGMVTPAIAAAPNVICKKDRRLIIEYFSPFIIRLHYIPGWMESDSIAINSDFVMSLEKGDPCHCGRHRCLLFKFIHQPRTVRNICYLFPIEKTHENTD